MEQKESQKENQHNQHQNIDNLNHSIDQISQLIHENPDDAHLYFRRAEVYFRKNELGKAINDYESVLRLAPENQEAKGKVEMAKTILKYNNTDIYANPNTDMDPWLE